MSPRGQALPEVGPAQEESGMPRNDKSRQQKVMKKRRKDKVRRKARAGISLSGSELERKRILEARGYPIHECLIAPDWREDGLAQILLSRIQPDGDLVAGVYLVDILCLGVKDTFAYANFSPSSYRARLRDPILDSQGLETCPIDLAHTIVYGGIDFARQFGFQPHRDFKLSRHLLEERDRLVLRGDVEFGRDGRPVYISGPHDDVRRIVAQLKASVGEGNYDFLIGGPPEGLRSGNSGHACPP